MPEVIKISDTSTLVPTSKYPYAKWEFDNFNPVQSKLFEVYEGDTNIAIAAATSAGKAQPLDAPILTPHGFIPMYDVKVGTYVISEDGRPTLVTGVYPQGKKLVFKVNFSDGTSASCCEDHLWSVRTKHDKCKNRIFRTKPLKELFNDLTLSDGHSKWYIPLLNVKIDEDVKFDHLPIHPYVLGAILGDGGIAHRIIFSNSNKEILERISNLLPFGVSLEFIENYDYQIVGGINEKVENSGFNRTNLIKKELKKLGLFGLTSCCKFIPEIYMTENPECRIELLRGLMDTDGTPNGNKSAEFSSCSLKLANDVCRLVRSLGGSTSVRKGKAGYINNDNVYVECQPRYRVTVNIGNLNPFHVSDKAKKQKTGLEKGRNRSIKNIEVVGYKYCQCISVEHPSSLYVTEDYVLTHNTVCSEMYLAYELRKRGGKGIYVGPLKALAKEKEQDWTDAGHHFGDVKTFIATGDFRFTAKRLAEMEQSQLIVMTPEMLASRARNHKSDKSKFLYDVGTVVFDESHLLTVPNRGDHIEVALMKLTEINPNVRIVFLSATMPNVDEICGWICEITGRDTYYLESDYRPCPLNIHYETYYDGGDYDDKEIEKIAGAISIVEHYTDDKFLIFTHTKRTGNLMVETLKRHGIKSEFHNADLTLKNRLDLEDRFKNDKSFRVMVATSTLAWGLNLPARRVIVTGVHRGVGMVENYDIQQMIGRAGRPKYDPRGDAYILIPESKKEMWIKHLKTKAPIRSTLMDFVGTAENPHYKTLAFHIVAEIHQGNVKTKEGFKEWFKMSLAHYQDHGFDDTVVDKTLNLLIQCHAIFLNDDEEFECTAIGKVASMFYYSPFDVSDLRRNFKKLFEDKRENNDFALSLALGNIDTHRWSICNKQEREIIAGYRLQIEKLYGKDKFTDAVYKTGCAYYNLLKGKHDVPVLQSLAGALLFDSERTLQVLNSLDSMSCRWDRGPWFKTLGMRLRYGVEADLVELCQIPSVGAVRAKRLKEKRIKTIGDFLNYDVDTLAKMMKCSNKVAQQALDGAREIELKDSIS